MQKEIVIICTHSYAVLLIGIRYVNDIFLVFWRYEIQRFLIVLHYSSEFIFLVI